MDFLMDFLMGLFSRDVLLVVLGSWLTILVQVFGLKGPLRRLIVDAFRRAEQDRAKPESPDPSGSS